MKNGELPVEKKAIISMYTNQLRLGIRRFKEKHPRIYNAHADVFEFIKWKAHEIAEEAYEYFNGHFLRATFPVIVFTNRRARWHRSEIAVVLRRDGEVIVTRGYKLDEWWTTESKTVKKHLKEVVHIW